MNSATAINFTEDKSVFDYAAWDRIWATAFDEAPNRETHAPSWLAKNLPDGTHGVFALSGEEVIGFVSVFTDDILHAWVADLAVNRTYQRAGIGAELLRRVSERFDHLSIQIHAIQEPTFGLCRKAGLMERTERVPCARGGTIKDIWKESALGDLGLQLSQNFDVNHKTALRSLLGESGFSRQASVLDDPAKTDKFFGPLVSGFLVLDADEPVAFGVPAGPTNFPLTP